MAGERKKDENSLVFTQPMITQVVPEPLKKKGFVGTITGFLTIGEVRVDRDPGCILTGGGNEGP